MSQTATPTADLEQLGWAAARQVAGNAVEALEVAEGVNAFDEPAYHFTFLLDAPRAPLGLGMTLIRLRQAVANQLLARGDEHVPTIRLLDRAGWDQHAGPRSH